MSKLIFLVVAVCIGVACAAVAGHNYQVKVPPGLEKPADALVKNYRYQNKYDAPINFQCGRSQAIKRIGSKYSNGHGDRRFKFSCASYGSGGVCSDCKTTAHYVNKFKEVISYNCPANQVLTGVESVHNNNHEDRRWKFRCCSTFEHVTTNCEMTEYINQLGKKFDYTVSGGKVVVGMHSYWANKDRRWKLTVCDFGKKKVCKD